MGRQVASLEPVTQKTRVMISCEVVVPNLSKILENINEVKRWLEEECDSEHLHLLHLINIKQYVLKKMQQFQQTILCDCFCREA
jgi:hypothetical protein